MKIKRNYKTYAVIGIVLGIILGTFMGVMAKGDSFGNSTKTLDFSKQFNNAFKNHVFWTVSYKRYESSDWIDGSEYLTIEKTYNSDLVGWKFNLILDIPVNIYEAKFGFGVDKPVINHVEKLDQYRYYLNYSGYSCFFDWTDLTSVNGLKFEHGIISNYFYFGFSKNNIPAGHYEFDPYFGSTTTGGTLNDIRNQVKGSVFNVAGDVCFNVTNMSAYIRHTGNHSITMGIWDNNTKTLVAQTEVRHNIIGSETDEWITCNFTTNYTLYGNVDYLLGVISNATGSCHVYGQTGGYRLKDDYVFDNSLPNPFDVVNSANYIISIYCNYTIVDCPEEETNYTLDEEGCYCFSLAPSFIGFILIFLFFYTAERKTYVMLYFFSSFISVIMGVYYMILLDGISFTSWIGIILVLFGVYSSFLGLAYSINFRHR